jgi:four helix bundle protein
MRRVEGVEGVERVEGVEAVEGVERVEGVEPFKLFQLFQLLQQLFVNCTRHRCINLIIKPMYTFSFERLDVWNKSRLLTKKIYNLTKDYPDSEKFGLINQLRRAVISVCSNIAEGSSRKSKKDQSHFYNMAFSSLMETLNQLIISNDLDYLDASVLRELRNEIHTISLMLNRLIVYSNGK